MVEAGTVPILAARGRRGEGTGKKMRDILIRSIVPLILALITGALILAMLGVDAIAFYSDIFRFGLLDRGWQSSIVRAAPLLLIALGLIVVFRGKLWNLGYDGQFLLAAAFVMGVGPILLVAGVPPLLMAVIMGVFGAAIAAVSTVVPAFLKAQFGTNEIISSLMMSFILIGVANMLVKGPFRDTSIQTPQTLTIPLDGMLPSIPGTRINIGIIAVLVIVVIAHLVLTRTSFGLRLDVYGSSPRAASHVGMSPKGTIYVLFAISGACIGLAAAVDMLGLWGYLRANWNPAYGTAVLPFVFLARLNVLGSIPLVFFYAVLATGGTLAAQRNAVSVDFLLVIVALILVFMTVIEYFGTRRDLGKSYLPDGAVRMLRSLRAKEAK